MRELMDTSYHIYINCFQLISIVLKDSLWKQLITYMKTVWIIFYFILFFIKKLIRKSLSKEDPNPFLSTNCLNIYLCHALCIMSFYQAAFVEMTCKPLLLKMRQNSKAWLFYCHVFNMLNDNDYCTYNLDLWSSLSI